MSTSVAAPTSSTTTTPPFGEVEERTNSENHASNCIEFYYTTPTADKDTTTTTNECTPFPPMFTHQCFEKEMIKGYTPFRSKDDNPTTTDAPKLRIQVYLSPCWDVCDIRICIQDTNTQQPHKKRRLDDHENTLSENSENDNANNNNMKNDNKPTNTVVKNANANANADATTNRMSQEEILRRMSKGLPKIRKVLNADDTNKKDTTLQEMYLDLPKGNIIQEYTTSTNSTFVISHVNETQISKNENNIIEFHKQIQRVALWYIESFDEIQLSNHNGSNDNDDDNDDSLSGYWNLLYLWQKHTVASSSSNSTNHYYSLVGFVTLYHFYAPFKKPNPGIVMRICQMMILPPYQKCNHGKQFMNAIYNLAHNTTTTTTTQQQQPIVEINVEDPSPTFTYLRNTIDYQRYDTTLFSKDDFWKTLNIDCNTPKVPEDFQFPSLSQTQISDYASQTKLGTKQIMIIYEIHLYRQIMDGFLKNRKLPKSIKTLVTKKYKIFLKKRLKKEPAFLEFEEQEHQPLASSSLENPNPNEKQLQVIALEKYYQKVIQDYKKIIIKSRNQ